MTAQPLEQPAAHAPWPAKTLDGITETILGNATDDVVVDFTCAVGEALACARAANPTQRLQPLHDLVEAWWPQAVFWTDPVRARQILADVADIQKNCLGDRPRYTQEQAMAAWEAHNGRKLHA